MWQHTPVSPAHGRWGQEDQFKASLKATPGEAVGLLGGLPDSAVVTGGTEIFMWRDRYIGHVLL